MSLKFHQFPCLEDNYGVLVHDPVSGATASVDAPDAREVLRQLENTGWQLTHILTTHHHGDHTGGNRALKAETGCTIIGPRAEGHRIPEIDQCVGEHDVVAFGEHEIRVLDTPGHTAGHISYWIPSAATAFVGDTLFAMGCGRLLEGDPETMWNSLGKLMRLPPETQVYCGHEYTLANARFALTIEPDNETLRNRADDVRSLRAANQPTLPTTIAEELATNPFLRADEPAIRKRLGLEDVPVWQVFAEIRKRKNQA